MGKPYSLDLRERIVGYVEQGHSARAASRVFGACTAVRLAAVRLSSIHRALIRAGYLYKKRAGGAGA